MKGRNYLLLIISIMIISFTFNVSAKSYSFYVDSTCQIKEADCYQTLDDALEVVNGDKTSAEDTIDLNICDPEVSFSHSYTINGKLKFVIDDVSNDNKFTLNGNNNTITTAKYIEFTGNAEMTISNFNVKDTLADARNSSFTLGLYSQYVTLNSVSVISLKYMGIYAGDNLAEYEMDGVQVSGAEVGLDYFGKSLNINNGTFDDNTMGFTIGGSETTITNSKINSIKAYDGADITIDSSNTLVSNPIILFADDDANVDHSDIDFDENFVISFTRDSKIVMNLVKDSDVVLDKKNNKIDVFKLFNGIKDIELDSVAWTTTNDKVAKIQDGYVILQGSGEATVSGTLPNSNIKLSVNFRVKDEKDNTFTGKIKNIVKNPQTYSTLFIVCLLGFVLVTTIVVYNRRRKEIELKDVI